MRLPGAVGSAWAETVRSEKRRVKRAMKVRVGILENIVLGAGRDLRMWLERECNVVKVGYDGRCCVGKERGPAQRGVIYGRSSRGRGLGHTLFKSF
jgi:hypothetical protein